MPARGRRCEVAADTGLLFHGCAREQSQQQEERHHRGHEVSIGDLPGAVLLDLLDDDDRMVVPGFRLGYVPRVNSAWGCLKKRLSQRVSKN